MATNYARASYTEVYDICTRAGTPTMIGIHTPTSNRPLALMSGLWTQFKKVKYGGCKVSMVPASTLPADPLQLSADASQLDSIDPRDMLNPVLFRGYIGESLGYFLDNALGTVVTGYNRAPFSSLDVSTASSDVANATFKAWYYQNLISREWKKTSVQSGFTKSGLHPRIWSLGVDHPILPIPMSVNNNLPVGLSGSDQIPIEPGMSAFQNASESSIGTTYANGVEVGSVLGPSSDMVPTGAGEYAWKSPTFRTIKSVPLGWQDTISNNNIVPSNVSSTPRRLSQGDVHYTNIGKHFMALIVLPPSEKTVFYFRMVVKHFYEFKNFRYAFINQPGNGNSGNRTYPVPPSSANGALSAIPMEWTIGYPETESKDVGVYNTDAGDFVVNETGTLDVLNGQADFVTDSVA